MALRCAALVTALLILSALTAYGEDCLMGRYSPTQSSFTEEKLQLPLALSWEFVGSKFRGNPAAPVVADGTVYFACGDRVYAVYMSTGCQKWRYPSSDQGLAGSVKGTPAVYEGGVYFGAGDENLYCVDAQTGAFRWAYKVRGAIRCPPVVEDGVVYIGADDESLYAIDAANGDHRWRFTARDDIAVGVALGQGMAVVSSMDGNMYGVAVGSGKLRWTPFRLPVAPTASSPVISENLAIMAVGPSMYGLSVRSGQQKWQTTLQAETAATPAVQGFDVYVPCRDKKLYAYSVTGRRPGQKWAKPADLGSMPMSSPVLAGDMVWVTTSRGTVAAYSADTGDLKWRYAFTPSAVTTPTAKYCDASSSPTIAEGALLALTDDSVLHCFTPQAPDNQPPMVFSPMPPSGTIMSGAPPIKISAVLYDIGSGVDFDSATITLDGQAVDRTVDRVSSTVSFQTEMGGEGKQATVLSNGIHRIVASAKDYSGNLLTKEWYIITDDTLPPPRRAAPTEQPSKKKREPKRPRNVPMPPGMPGANSPTSPGIDMPPPPPPAPGGPPSDGGYHRGRG